MRSERYINTGTLTRCRRSQLKNGRMERGGAAVVVGGGWQLYLPAQPVVSSELMSARAASEPLEVSEWLHSDQFNG